MDEAIACFKKAIELDPKFAAAPGLLAKAERHGSGPGQARSTSRRASYNRRPARSASAWPSGARSRSSTHGGRPVRRRLRRRPQAGRRPEGRPPLQRRLLRIAGRRRPGRGRGQARRQRSEPACANRPSTGSAPTWPCAPSNWRPASPPTAPRCSRRCATGSRTPTWPASATRRPWPSSRRRTEGVYPALGRRGGAAEEGERPTEPRLAPAATARGPQGAPQGQPATGRIARPDRPGPPGAEEVDRGRAAPPRVPGHPRADAARRLVHLQHQVAARRRRSWARRNTPTPSRCSWPATRG